jgi:hypothetical protein
MDPTIALNDADIHVDGCSVSAADVKDGCVFVVLFSFCVSVSLPK